MSDYPVSGTLPDWLSEPQKYIPEKDKDNFLNRSCLSFVHILSGIRRRDHQEMGSRIHPAWKLLCVLVMILLIAMAKQTATIYLLTAFVLLQLALLNGEEIRSILKGTWPAVLFTFLMMLPALIWNRSLYSLLLCLRVFLSVTELGIFVQTTRWNQITGALRIFHLPNLFLFLLDVTMQYIVLLGKEALEMLYALKCRSIGHNSHKGQAVGDIAGITFLKSREMSMQLYQAMVCRGFDGTYPRSSHRKLTWRDPLYLAPHLLVLVLWVMLEWKKG